MFLSRMVNSGDVVPHSDSHVQNPWHIMAIRAKTGGAAVFPRLGRAKKKSALHASWSSKTPRQVEPKTGGNHRHRDPRSGSMAGFRCYTFSADFASVSNRVREQCRHQDG